MRPPFRTLVRHARPLAALTAVALSAACRDSTSITDPTAATAAVPASVAAAPSATPGAPLNDVFPTTANGTLVPGGPYNLRSGPGTNYQVLGTTNGGVAVATVCTATRTSRSGSAVVWHRLSTSAWIAGGFVDDSGTPAVCDSPAGPQVAPGVRGNDYPFASRPASGCSHDVWGYCVRQCTSFVAWRMRNVNGIANFVYGYGGTGWGNAKDWATTARTLGYRVDHSPEVGAIAQWTSSSSGMGHVAWVASVSSDKRSVTVEEYNYYTSRGYDQRTISASSVNNFIHVY